MGFLAYRWRTILSYVLIFGLLAAVNLLPPDTSLSEVRAAGVLRACLPSVYPPLVTGDPAAPGIDIELLRELATGMDLRLAVTLLGGLFLLGALIVCFLPETKGRPLPEEAEKGAGPLPGEPAARTGADLG